MFLNFLLNIIAFFGLISGSQSFYYPSSIIELENLPLDFSLSADKAAVFAEEQRSFLYTKKIDEPQPIASITKLMTAIIFLEEKPNLNKIYKITEDDRVEGGRIHLFLGDELTLKDLFYTSLIASDNGATLAMVHALGLKEEDFILKMNAKAKSLNLLNTSFEDPIGLGEENISTAREIITLFKEAKKYPEITEAILLPEYRYETVQGREKIIESTDEYLLTNKDFDLTSFGGKTGYIDEAGYCFVGEFKNQQGESFIVAVLNSNDKNSRFSESQNLIKWLNEKYELNK
ncbi:D-alanyl-D-alanine carboxypeptidase [Patescibacteria group bacterium]|nr:D-alanyl-D-alanine carboxypeptidase [Patescibacteria group bacterium]